MDAGGYAACFDHQQLALLCANSDRTIDRIGVENNKLKAENAKLRELVRDAIYARDDADWASIVSTAIALGVEVDA